MMDKLITMDSVGKNDKHGHPIIKEVTGSVFEGEFITIIGPSGSGKSTLLALLNRMIDPDRGVLKYKGKPYQEIDVLELRRKIGMVFQVPTMIQGTVKDNILIGPRLRQKELSEKEVDQLLDWVDLPPSIKNQDARTLSGGQKQKVALARTLANPSQVLLLDEVTASLDPKSTLEIEQLIKTLHEKQRKTILWVTHHLKQAERLGEYTWVIADGRLMEQGMTKDVFNHPKHDITKEFLSSALEKEEGDKE